MQFSRTLLRAPFFAQCSCALIKGIKVSYIYFDLPSYNSYKGWDPCQSYLRDFSIKRAFFCYLFQKSWFYEMNISKNVLSDAES